MGYFDPETGRKLKITELQEKFLDAFGDLATVTHAAAKVGCSRQQHYEALKLNPDYKIAFDEAQSVAADNMEFFARMLAMKGWMEPIYHNGELVGQKPKYSAALIIFIMKGLMPDKYADRQKTEITGVDPVQVYLPANGRDDIQK
ncbi:hypothetical protein [Rubinisphaera brasiliensis]|uniref:Terminase small subunit n=1 Tax=Rubinisphaera brasiliensis (strain ATCC 49424 / DSM 5305 / JCM 21570 / IAM 15109 / NBRC 103401 / IFAM 1448) TaxID=756272 RepID=F0SNL1_RUBBR|nr:hypothetical protein [Rubinisphaera brasiliensis]ADY57845.1 hypothetical protein Plabr_0216 [Rubinisphaera brasiliensis DSM 5305]